MLGLLLLASLLPAFGAARYTVVSYKSERARDTKRPFWQRAWYRSAAARSGVLRLLPAQASVGQSRFWALAAARPTRSRTRCCCWRRRCIFSRWRWWWCACSRWRCACWPGCSSRLPGISTITALRYLSRTPRAYTGPILLLVLTLSLASFTASMAATLDSHMFDRICYDAGGDMRAGRLWAKHRAGRRHWRRLAARSAQRPISRRTQIDEAKYLFLPVSEYLTIPGVTAATGVARVPLMPRWRTSPAPASCRRRSGRFPAASRLARGLRSASRWAP